MSVVLVVYFFFYLHLCPFSLSLFHDPDEGHKEFVVEVFENQSRSFPGGDFKPADQNWSDAVTCISLFCSICSLFKVETHETIRVWIQVFGARFRGQALFMIC